MRDLKADFELCKQYQDNIGPWFSKDGFPTKHLIETATFLNQVRSGWPHAIERALELEEELTRCGNTLVELTIALKDERKRADKAEELARELVDTLNVAQQSLHENGIGIVDDREVMNKAEEVLGDDVQVY